MSKILIEKIFNKIEWGGEPRKKLSKVNDAYNGYVKKRKVSVQDFYEGVLARDLFVAAILLLRKREELDSSIVKEYQQKILDLCQKCAEKSKYMETEEKEFFDNLANALAVSLLYEQAKLTERIIICVYRCIDDKYKILLFFQMVFRYIYSIDEMGKSFVLLLNVMYKIFDVDVNERVLRKFEIQLEINEAYKDSIRKLIATALRKRQIVYINIMLRIFREIPLNDLDINKNMLVKSIKKGHVDEFLDGILLLRRVCVSSAKSYEDGMNKWWQVINKRIAPKNIMWPPYEGYLQVYYISKLIQHNPAKTDIYVCLVPQTSRTTILKEEYSTIIQETTELLFDYEYKYLEKYLEFLGENNVFQYNKDVITKPFYVERNYYFIKECIEKYIAKGAGIKELVDAYMNTYLRVAYSLFSFCDILVAHFDSLIHSNTADLSEVFGNYEINAIWVNHQGSIRFEIFNVNCANQLLRYSYLNQEFVNFILNGKEVLSVYCLLDKYMLESREVCISLDLKKEGIDPLVGGLIELCNRISEKGYLEESDKHKLFYFSIPEEELDKDQKVDLSLCILDTCLELSIHSKDILEFLDALQAVYGKKNPFLFLGYNDAVRGYHEMFEKQEIQHILNVWEMFKERELSLYEAVNIYIHTVLRFFVPFSSVLCTFDKSREKYLLNDILGRYLFTGEVIKAPNNSQVAYIDQMDFLLYDGEDVLCDIKVLSREGIKKNTQCIFRLAFYNCKDFCVYAVKKRQQNATKEKKDNYKENLYKLLLTRMPDKAYFEQLKYADVSFEYADKLEIENIQIAFLERYVADITIINRFLTAIQRNNFCVHSKESLQKMGVIAQEINSPKVINVMREILLHNNEEVLLKIYFNTSLKYYADFNRLLKLVSEIGNMNLLIKYMAQYPLWVSTAEYGLDAINFLGYDIKLQIKQEKKPVEEGDEEEYAITEKIEGTLFEKMDLKCCLVEYKTEMDTIILEQLIL